MSRNPTSIEQTIARALRENLEKLQRMSYELHQAVADLVAACASNRPANALPPMIRAQASAAALAAALEVLSRFISAATHSGEHWSTEQETLRAVSLPAAEPAPLPARPPRSIPEPMAEAEPVAEPAVTPVAVEKVAPTELAATPAAAEAEAVAEVEPPPPAAFDIATLTAEEQELHRRANRVAKVSMQDIQLLRPEQVRLGREHRDIYIRLRNDIEKAHKEYNRRFRPILDHPVDYFYHWLVEILAGGDPEKLGEYPYQSPVSRR